VNVALFSFHKV